MKKVQDTHLNIGGLNWPVLINVEQVCRVMVDLKKHRIRAEMRTRLHQSD